MNAEKVLLEMGFVPRFIKTLDDKERYFISSLRDIYDEICNRIKILYPNLNDEKISIALKRLSYYFDDDMEYFSQFEKDLFKIIKSEERERKLNLLLSESRILNFSEFNIFF